eukprot:TRINITY_DN414_c0_g1_i2.p1 TRINITY_DN414_c0_g1~~TRINITY_DN414_c0_g1_i2.p1  ORF type:complete len:1361 (+),score=369.81 TRINITY_DN414_c0_g1_i2:324-4406(+)
MEGGTQSLDSIWEELERLEQQPCPAPSTQHSSHGQLPDFRLTEVGQLGYCSVTPVTPENKQHASVLVRPFSVTRSVLPQPQPSPSEFVDQYLAIDVEDCLFPLGGEHRGKFWPRELNNANTIDTKMELTSPLTDLVVTEDGYSETHSEASPLPSHSTSLLRTPGNRDDFHRGSSSHYPFLPGGIDPEEVAKRRKAGSSSSSAAVSAAASASIDLDSANLKMVAPGLEYGVLFDTESGAPVAAVSRAPSSMAEAAQASVSLVDIAYTRRLRPPEGRREGIEMRRPQVSMREAFGAADDAGTPSTPVSQAHDSAAGGPSTASTLDKDASTEVPGEKQQQSSASTVARSNSLENLLQSENWMEALEARRKGPSSSSSSAEMQTWAVMARMENLSQAQFQHLVPNMAVKYPFELDGFQKEAVVHLERGESVFVAAHTSAGKTVVAEYAIALAKKHMTRTIYTSPIKALSNQKFRDFKNSFGDVGLITGDVSVAPESSCLIVTTEILRSMLYKGADLIRDVEWVIFDEVHYINDSERGVVWEEVIIMLPAHVNIILLSATVPNTFEFADWVGRTKRKKIYVISTNKRPTPLEHYVFANNELHKVVDSARNFLSLGYKKAQTSFKEKKSSKPTGRGGGGGFVSGALKARQEISMWPKFINKLKKDKLLPVVVFAFSKRKCEELAYGLTNIDLTTHAEKSETHVFIEHALQRLKGPDRKLPQVLRIKELLKLGVGVHHGGLLPIIKEVVEILFSRGLVKVLFATETFAMGVNMPARTVVFNQIRKHDGQSFRDLLPGEYTQMAGRAGRRGIDSVGTVIIASWHEVAPSSTLHTIMLGRVQRLESQFRLTYNMILNLLRVEDLRVEDMIKRSYSESENQRGIPEQKALLKLIGTKLDDFTGVTCIEGAPDIENYHDITVEIASINEMMAEVFEQSRQAMQALVPGRVLFISTKAHPYAVGVILSPQAPDAAGRRQFQVLLLPLQEPRGGLGLEAPTHSVVVIGVGHISAICKKKIQLSSASDEEEGGAFGKGRRKHIRVIGDPNSFESDKRGSGGGGGGGRTRSFTDKELSDHIDTRNQLRQVMAASSGGGGGGRGMAVLNPVSDLRINSVDFAEAYTRKCSLEAMLMSSKCHACPKMEEHFAVMDTHHELKVKAQTLRHAVSENNLALMPEFNGRLMILEHLQYVNESHAVQLKGRVAREINTVTNELIATELVFENILTDLEPTEIVSLLSCLIFEQKSDDGEMKLPERLLDAKEKMVSIAMRLAEVQMDYGLDTPPREFVKEALHFGMMEVVYEWARGMPFAEICELTDILEGSIVRCIVRLDETCKELRNAARIIGDSRLYSKAQEASSLIKRDIVFASSLYIS